MRLKIAGSPVQVWPSALPIHEQEDEAAHLNGRLLSFTVAHSFRPRYNATLLSSTPSGMSLMLRVAGDTTIIMEVIVQRDQSQGIRDSLKWRLSLQAVLQWIIAILL